MLDDYTHTVDAIGRASVKSHPYPNIVVEDVFPSAQADELAAWLSDRGSWWRQERDFYTHDSCENLDDCPLAAEGGILSASARSVLARELARKFGIALDDTFVSLCAHRMGPGHGIG